MATERLQKLLAQAGVASRRAAEALILEGRVRVNGRIVTVLGTKADLHHDKVEVDGKRLVAEKPAYYLLNKPREVVTTLDDPEGRDTIAGLLRGVTERVYPVGRLDYHTSGALLITNDGDMAQALLHPKKSVPKTYVCKVRGHLDVPQLDKLRNGVDIGNGETTRKAELFVLREEQGNTWVQITITEGKNRQIHRMFEALGYRVARLSRVAFAGLTVEGLRPGDYRELKGTELQKLKRDYLNPAKRADAEEKEQLALDAAMQDLGYIALDEEEPVRAPRPRSMRSKNARASAPTKQGPTKQGPAKRAPFKQGPAEHAPAKKTAGRKTAGTKTMGTKTMGTKAAGNKTVGTKTMGKKTAGNRTTDNRTVAKPTRGQVAAQRTRSDQDTRTHGPAKKTASKKKTGLRPTKKGPEILRRRSPGNRSK